MGPESLDVDKAKLFEHLSKPSVEGATQIRNSRGTSLRLKPLMSRLKAMQFAG